jgi:putative addiction module antidote
MTKLTVRRVGNSLGVILPQEVISQLRVGEGDTITLTQSPEGMRLTPYNPEFDRQMELAQKGIRKYRNALRELAK